LNINVEIGNQNGDNPNEFGFNNNIDQLIGDNVIKNDSTKISEIDNNSYFYRLSQLKKLKSMMVFISHKI